MKIRTNSCFVLPFMLMLAGCGGHENSETPVAETSSESHGDDGEIVMSADQVASAGIQTARPTIGGSATIDIAAMIEGDPQGTQIVSAAISGRIMSLTRNLGQSVERGQTLAVIESREAATLNAEIDAARARLTLAQSNLSREQRLFDQRVSPEQDLIAARTAATEARIALRLAQSQVSAAGAAGGSLNRIAVIAPASGQVIGRSALLGQSVAADAELFRIANLSTVSLSFNLQPADAGRVRPGAIVTVRAPGREGQARVRFVSPALDMSNRQVPVIATIDNRGGQWRIGEAVTASVQLSGDGGDGAVRVPLTAVQSYENRSVLFVRTATGFQLVPVVMGDTSGDMVIVKSGLKGNEQVATVNSFTLKAELGKGEASHED